MSPPPAQGVYKLATTCILSEGNLKTETQIHIDEQQALFPETFLQPSGFIFNCTLYLFEIYCDIIYEVINFLSLKLPSHQHLLNNPSSL